MATVAPAAADTGGKIQPGTPAVAAGGDKSNRAANVHVCASPNGKADFVWQTDGNLVDYDENGTPLWASNAGRGAYYVPLQADGNSVIYDAGGNPVWASNTAGHPSDWLVCQDDGNVVIYDPGPNPLWATGTQH